jgi:ADP-ribosylglycohydrolase
MTIQSSDHPSVRLVQAPPSRDTELFSVVIGSLVAGASADALGWVTEFMRTPAAIQRQLGLDRVDDYVGWRKKVGGRFNTYIDFIGPGEYSDDTQLTLALARAIRFDGAVDHEYFAKRELAGWLEYARGAGRTVTAAAKAMSRPRTAWDKNFFVQGTLDYLGSGANGAAMRVAPIVLANLRTKAPPLDDVFANAITTHGHPRAHVGALAFAAGLWEVVRRREEAVAEGPRAFLDAVKNWLRGWTPTRSSIVEDWLQIWETSVGEDYGAAWDRTVGEFEEMLSLVGQPDHHAVLERLGCFARETRGSGTSTVAAALHLFCFHGGDVEAAVVEAVNAVPADTDTIGAMVGHLAGAYAGYESVPERWTTRLQDMPYFIAVGEALTRVALRDADESVSLRPRLLKRDEEVPEIKQLLLKGTVERELRVRHDVLGTGWVQAVHAQEIRRRGGGEMLYARVALDIGQTCQFRSHLSAQAPR